METTKKSTQTKKGNQKTSQKNENIDKGNVPFSSSLYKNNPSDKKENKKFRSKMRAKRNRLIGSILKANEEKNTELRNEKIQEFHTFYKENYVKNDYSPESILGQSSDESTREYITDFLTHLKKWKVS